MACITTFSMASVFLSQPGGITTDLLLPPGESTMTQAFDGKFEVIEMEPSCQYCEYYNNGVCEIDHQKHGPAEQCNISKKQDRYEPVFELSSRFRNLKLLQPEDYEKYDYLLVNVSPVLLSKLHKIRQEIGFGSSTKLIGNMDHGIDIASHHFNSYNQLKIGLNLLDMIFSVEPVQRSFVQRMLPMREIYDIPHCLDIEKHKIMGDMFKDEREQNTPKNIMITYHEYEHPILMPLVAISDPRLADMKPLLIGYEYSCNTCAKRKFCPDKRGSKFVCKNFAIGFDGFEMGLRKKPYPTHMKEMAMVGNLGYESYQIAGIGRYGMQWAAMGIPAFVPNVNRSHSLFDYEPTSPKDFKQIGNILARLKQNRNGWTDDILEKAYQRVKEEYSFKAVREKVIAAVENEEKRNV